MPQRAPIFRPSWQPDRATVQRQYDRTPERAGDLRWYNSRPWRRVCILVLSRDKVCVKCKAKGLIVAATTVHHILERKQRPDLALDPTNLEGVCGPCHSRHHAEQKGNDR